MNYRTSVFALASALVCAGLVSSVTACSSSEETPAADAKKKKTQESSSKDKKEDDDDDSDSKPPRKNDKKPDGGLDAGPSDAATSPDAPSTWSHDAAAFPDSSSTCGPLVAGDLAIVEFVPASKASGPDTGEWIEIKSMRACTVNLKGVSVVVAARPNSPAQFLTDTHLPPLGRFVVTNSTSWTSDGGVPPLPGLVISFPNPLVELGNELGEIHINAGATRIETFPYSIPGEPYFGVSWFFPEACPWSSRSDSSKWQDSYNEWTLDHYGTPNAPNEPVACK